VSKQNVSPCESCPTRQTCKKICDKLEAFLPSVDGGRYRRVQTVGLDPKGIPVKDAPKRLLTREVLHNLQRLRDERDRRIALAFYLDGKPQREIAQEMGCSQQWISRRISAIKAQIGRLVVKRA